MKQLSSVDVYYLAQELKFFEEQRVDNFYYSNGMLYLRVYVKSRGNFYIAFSPGYYLYITKNKNFQSEGSGFTRYLRKNVGNTFIKSIENIPNERIIKIKTEGKEAGTNFLFLELFKPGNMTLTNESLIILNTLTRKKFKDRQISVKEKYQLPPERNVILEKENLEDNKIVKVAASQLGLGGKYGEELISRTGLDKNRLLSELSETEIKTLEEERKNLYNHAINPCLIKSEDGYKDFTPFDFKSITDEKEKTEHFYEALYHYFRQFEKQEDPKEKELKEKIRKLQNRLTDLEEKKSEVLNEYEKYKTTGDKIYENYAIVERLIELGDKIEKGQLKELPEDIKPYVKKIDKKEKSLELEK